MRHMLLLFISPDRSIVSDYQEPIRTKILKVTIFFTLIRQLFTEYGKLLRLNYISKLYKKTASKET